MIIIIIIIIIMFKLIIITISLYFIRSTHTSYLTKL